MIRTRAMLLAQACPVIVSTRPSMKVGFFVVCLLFVFRSASEKRITEGLADLRPAKERSGESRLS